MPPLQYLGHLMRRVDSLEKTLDAGKDWGQEEKETTEDEMAGWHHGLDERESEWTPGVGDGQGGLACCDSWGSKESDTTDQLNWTELNHDEKAESYVQMKGQDKIPEKQRNEVETASLPRKEFRIMIVKMTQDVRKRIEAKIEKIQKMFTKDLEELKNKQTDK